jgi:orotate phosphoribosyltransferase
MLHPEGAYLIGLLVTEALAGETFDLVGGLEMGAVPIVTAVAAVSHSKGRPLPAFFVRKATKDHGTKSLVEGLPRGQTLKGKRVVIVDDVVTTGGSSMKAVDAVRMEGAEVVRVIAIVDREEGAAETFANAGLPFTALITAGKLRGV